MSSGFYARVSALFALLDLDGDGMLLKSEARLGLDACFDDVHRATEELGGREAVLQQQVEWLWAATEAHEAVNAQAFKECYAKLLAAAYEEEVLVIDLQRAIDSLERSQRWQDMRALFGQGKQIMQAAATERLLASDAKHKAVLDALFAPITGRSNAVGPKKQTAARKLVAPFLAADGTALDQAALTKLYHELMALGIPVEMLTKGAQDALLVASGEPLPAAAAAAAASPSASSPSASAASAAQAE